MTRRTRTLLPIVLLLAAACGGRPQLEPDAAAAFNRLEAVRIINDVGDVAIAAHTAGTLSTEVTGWVLRVGWQVRDFIEVNPTTTYARVIVAINEGLDVAPAAIRVEVSKYFDAAVAALNKLQGDIR